MEHWLEIGREKDWRANAPALCEHGLKKNFSFLYFGAFFSEFQLKKYISALRYFVPTQVSNLAPALGLLFSTCETSIL